MNQPASAADPSPSPKSRFLLWLSTLSPYHSDHRRLLAQALLYLYASQTEEEKVARRTGEHNSCGFTAFDAEFLTSVAESVLDHDGDMTDGQAEAVRKRLRKYAGQLAGWWQAIERVREQRKSA